MLTSNEGEGRDAPVVVLRSEVVLCGFVRATWRLCVTWPGREPATVTSCASRTWRAPPKPRPLPPPSRCHSRMCPAPRARRCAPQA